MVKISYKNDKKTFSLHREYYQNTDCKDILTNKLEMTNDAIPLFKQQKNLN
jgi:hypothetical protein